VSISGFFSFFGFVFARFREDDCTKSAAVLTYASLLSLVPALAVGFAMFSAFPVFSSLLADVQDFIFLNFVPTLGDVIQEHVDGFVKKASRVTGFGIGFLIFTVLMTIGLVDRTLNDIWRVQTRRRPVARFTVYWAAITLGPVLIGISLAMSSYFFSLPMLGDEATVKEIRSGVLVVLPFLLMMLAFTLLYNIVPNRHVPRRHALVGGFVAAVLFELGKKVFAIYVKNFASYEAIYGAMAAIPVFLIWIYVSWIITLYGAEIARCLSVYHVGVDKQYGERARFVITLGLLKHLWDAQASGGSLSDEQLLRQEANLHEDTLRDIMDALKDASIVRRTEDGDWMLAKDLSSLSVLDLYRSLPYSLPKEVSDLQGLAHWSHALAEPLEQALGGMSASLDIPLKVLYEHVVEEQAEHGQPDDGVVQLK
jgi:membrane protein